MLNISAFEHAREIIERDELAIAQFAECLEDIELGLSDRPMSGVLICAVRRESLLDANHNTNGEFEFVGSNDANTALLRTTKSEDPRRFSSLLGSFDRARSDVCERAEYACRHSKWRTTFVKMDSHDHFSISARGTNSCARATLSIAIISLHPTSSLTLARTKQQHRGVSFVARV